MDKNDITVNGKRNMPLHTYISTYGDSISDAQLGAMVRRNYEEYKKRMDTEKPQRVAEGKNFRTQREIIKMSRTDLSSMIGVSPQTIKRFEDGEPVRSRNMMTHSFKTAMNYEVLKRDHELHKLTF